MIDYNFNIDNDFNNEDNEETKIDLKKYIKPTIKIILLIITIYFLYWFFIGRYHIVSFVLEPSNVNIDMISIYKDGKLIKSINKNDTIKLTNGNYTFQLVNLKDYYVTNNNFELTSDDDKEKTISIFLKPNWLQDIDFNVIYPKKMLKSTNVNIKAIIYYKGTDEIDITFKGEGPLEDIEEIKTIKPGKNEFIFSMEVPKKSETTKICLEDYICKKLNYEILDKVNVTVYNLKSKYEWEIGSNNNLEFSIKPKQELNNAKITIKINDLNIEKKSHVLNLQKNNKETIFFNLDIPFNPELIGKSSKLEVFLETKDFSLPLKTTTLVFKEPEIVVDKTVDFKEIKAGTKNTKIININNKTSNNLNAKVYVKNINTINTITDTFESYINYDKKITLNPGKNSFKLTINPSKISDDDEFSFDLIFDINGIKKTTNVKGKISKINISLDLEVQDNINAPINQETNMTDTLAKITIKNNSDVAIDVSKISIYGESVLCQQIKIGQLASKTIPPKDTLENFLEIKIPAPDDVSQIGCNLIVSYINPLTNKEETIPQKVIFINFK